MKKILRPFSFLLLSSCCLIGTARAQALRQLQGLAAAEPQAQAIPEPARGMKELTIMVFMNGKNDLYNYALSDLNEMERAGVPANVNLVVEAGRRAYVPPPPSTNPFGFPNIPGFPGMMSPKNASWSGIRRYLIQKDFNQAEVTSPVLEEFNGDMGDWNHLAEFGLWAKSRFPARRYMLVVWNHGTGWKSAALSPELKGISYDDETQHHITGVQLGAALAKMGGLEVYASDACLMQMAEVAYELKDQAKVIIGSEETAPADGWPYHFFLAGIHNKPLTAETLAAAAVQGYNRYYAETTQKTTISAVYTRNLAALKTMTDQWAAAAMASGDRAGLKAARNDTKTFKDVESKDLVHFLTLAAQKSSSADVRAKSLALADLITSGVVFQNAYTGETNRNANGLGIYMPYSIPDTAYNALAWAKGGRWFEFINWIQK
ncbi:MAG: clostripain-related cysteine peptidase [Elusimicrobiales bacterium]|nr:clostripain-related cysteine peptidase [Elusimicrobiales bacterium]